MTGFEYWTSGVGSDSSTTEPLSLLALSVSNAHIQFNVYFLAIRTCVIWTKGVIIIFMQLLEHQCDLISFVENINFGIFCNFWRKVTTLRRLSNKSF